MDVFLIPVGADRYELYCEVAEDDDHRANPGASPRGFFAGLTARFREMVAAAERHHRRAAPARPAEERRSWQRRLRARLLGWVVEKIAEQRLLWHLRRQRKATAVFPADLAEPAAMRIIRASLQRDAERHRRWLIVDSIGFALSGLLALVPGPNLIAYYFAFRVVGHFLSMRGARHGLAGVEWRARASEPLAELRHALRLVPPERERRVRTIASELQLEHLASFFERIALPSA